MTQSSIVELLNKQEEKANELHALLSSELEILKARKLSILEAKAIEKENCLNAINQLDIVIKQHASLDALKSDTRYAEQVDRIIALFNECKEQNEINGQIINTSQIAINRFKGMLQKSISNNSMTYDQKGQTNIKNNSLGIKAWFHPMPIAPI